MSAPPSLLRPRYRWVYGLAVLGALLLAALVMTSHDLPVPNRSLLKLVYMAGVLPIVTGTLSVFYVRELRVREGWSLMLGKGIAVAVALGSLFAMVTLMVGRAYALFPPELLARMTLPGSALRGALFAFTTSAIWALVVVSPVAAEETRLRTIEAEKLKLEAEQLRGAAEIAQLRSRLEPHFLLNTLNAIAGLVTQDPREARRLLACLGDLLHDCLEDREVTRTVEDETRWLRRYAQILEARHGPRLTFHWKIADAAKGGLVPGLLLQPLVENAVKHGALRRPSGGAVTVQATVEDERLVCVIEDNGPGFDASARRPGGVGLHAAERRVALHEPGSTLAIESSATGTRAVVTLPFRLRTRTEGFDESLLGGTRA